MNKIGFGVLGPLQVSVDGTPVPLGTPKQRAVLAMLVMNRNRPVGIDSLITAAWEQWPPSEARASLHSYISNLRRLLGDSRSILETRRRDIDSPSATPTAPSADSSSRRALACRPRPRDASRKPASI